MCKTSPVNSMVFTQGVIKISWAFHTDHNLKGPPGYTSKSLEGWEVISGAADFYCSPRKNHMTTQSPQFCHKKVTLLWPWAGWKIQQRETGHSQYQTTVVGFANQTSPGATLLKYILVVTAWWHRSHHILHLTWDLTQITWAARSAFALSSYEDAKKKK